MVLSETHSRRKLGMRAQSVSRVGNRQRLAWLLFLPAVGWAALSDVPGAPEASTPRPYVDADGVAHLPAMSVPSSRFMSPESRGKFIALFSNKAATSSTAAADIRLQRERDERKNAPFVARAKILYPVNIEPKLIGGVRTEVITPKAGVTPENRTRVLINLHGGGFIWGEGNGARSESIPIAGLGRITVVTVAYRLGPEFHFPAASEDVAAVYRELLKDHRAADIGIYGCSAGGMLTAEAVAWFQKEGLPAPGAIGTFCGSLAPLGGDSSHLASPLVGELPSPGADSSSPGSPYFKGASPADPLVFPINSPRVLARFPPTLLIAGSRDSTVSSLFRAQAALTQVGVEAQLHVWDGMWHAFFMDPDLPESQEVYRVVVDFFDRHLGAPQRAPSRGS
jgi:epsilon-lactone hydrolase